MKISKKDQHFLKEYNILLDNSNGYYLATKNSKKYYLHRLIVGAKKGEIVDHKNRDKTDNRRSNLRIVSKKLNNYNRNTKNKYGRGIYFDKNGERFRANISHNGVNIKLGSFKDINEAKKAYNKKAFEIYGKDSFQHKILDTPHFEMNV